MTKSCFSLGRVSCWAAAGWLQFAGILALGGCAEIAGIQEAKLDDAGGATSRGGAESTAGRPSTSGGRSGEGGSTSPGSGGRSSGGTTSSEECNANSTYSCLSEDTIRYCDEESGRYQSATCGQFCDAFGQEEGPCEGEACACGNLTNFDCALGASNYCDCIDGGCSELQIGALYVLCHNLDPNYEPVLQCWSEASGECLENANECGAINDD